MNQAETQFNLQLFAEGETVEDSGQAAEQPQDDFEASKLRGMSQEDQIGYLSKHGFMGDEEEPKEEEGKAEPVQAEQPQTEEVKQEPAEEPTFEIQYNGQKMKVKQSELINLAQQGFDYTKKTQQLADQRRQYEALIAAAQVQKATQPQETKPKENRLQAEYQAAVSQAEQLLGIQPGEFNQFDPQHSFALQQIIMAGAVQRDHAQRQYEAVAREVQAFWAEEKKDPAAMQEVGDHFDEYLLKLGMSSPEGAAKAQGLAYAKERYLREQATPEDLAALKEHWNYVKTELAKAKQAIPTPVPKPPVNPPKTETPGASNTKETPKVLDRQQLRALSSDPDQQIAYLKTLGIFS